jgi:UDP-glucose:(heptosyl)LPS alpha-1,3-glucosyltransferase
VHRGSILTRLKIALAILHADPARGGAERYTIDAAAMLAGRGHDVSILATDFAEPVAGLRFVSLAAEGATKRGKFSRFLDAMDEHLAHDRYDVVHAMMPVRQCDLYHPHAGMAAEQMDKLHSRLNPRRRLLADVERTLLASPNAPVVVCLSDYVKRTIQKYYDLPPARLATLFNAVDLTRFEPGDPSRPHDVIGALMVAQDFERKGVRQAIEAVASLDDPRLTLTVLGRDNPAPYQRLAERLRIAGRVQFAGAVADPRPFYRAADFFLLPTRHDPCSLATLEALAMGLPVISTVFNGACEIMQPGVHGFVLPDPGDVKAIARAISKLADKSARLVMPNACLALRPKLSFDSHVDRLLEIYRSRLESRLRIAGR